MFYAGHGAGPDPRHRRCNLEERGGRARESGGGHKESGNSSMPAFLDFSVIHLGEK